MLGVKFQAIKCGDLIFKRFGCSLIGGNAFSETHLPVTQSIMFDISGAKPFH